MLLLLYPAIHQIFIIRLENEKDKEVIGTVILFVMLQMEMEFPKLTTMKNRRYPCNEESIIPQNKK